MPHSPRSPWKPVRVIDGGEEGRSGRCFACEQYLGVELPPSAYTYQPDPVDVAGERLEPGWYCPRCLQRARRTE